MLKRYFKALKDTLAANPPDYGEGNACSILEMLYYHYNEFNRMDTAEIMEDFEELYRRMNGLLIQEMDKIIDTVCALCRDHEKSGFIEGIKIGIRLESELAEE